MTIQDRDCSATDDAHYHPVQLYLRIYLVQHRDETEHLMASWESHGVAASLHRHPLRRG